MVKRASLTPKERNAMFYAQGGLCPVCREIMELAACIAEHTCPVALGNTDKPDCLLCVPCAKRKTHGTKATTAGSDIANIAKAKRLANGGRKAKQPFRKPPPGHKYDWGKRKVGDG